MPRASWNGFLRLSLVSCPVSLVPATTEAKRIRLMLGLKDSVPFLNAFDAEGKKKNIKP